MALFNRRPEKTVETDPLLAEKEELGRQIETDVNREINQPFMKKTKELLEEKLNKLRYIYLEPDEYKYEVLKRTIFYEEINKELQHLLAETLRGYQPEINIKTIKQKHSRQIESAINRRYDQYFQQYLSNSDGTTGLEQTLRQQLLMHQWLKKLLPYYQHNLYHTTDQLPKRWLVRRIEEECRRKSDEVLFF